MNTFDIDFKENKRLYLYYLVLHLICMSWTNISMVEPHIVLRFLITACVFLPLIKYFWLTPAVITLFVGIRFNSVAPFGYIPQSWTTFCYLVVAISLLNQIIYKKKYLRTNHVQLSLLFLLYIIDVINLKFFSELILFTLILFIFYNILDKKKTILLTILSFIILSISLSLYYFLFAEKFLISNYSYDVSGLERSLWVDPNYFGILLGIGVLFSFYFLISRRQQEYHIFLKVLFYSCIILSFIVIVLQASRGAIFALFLSMIYITSFIKLTLKKKISLIFITLIGLFFLLEKGVFDLLILRVNEDQSTGGGRFEIWNEKLSYLMNYPRYLIGAGYKGSIYDFPPFNTDCHNEFISTLLNYGILGLLLLLLIPFKIFLRTKKYKVIVIALLLYSYVAFFTLSPISSMTGWVGIPLLFPIILRLSNNNLGL